MYRIIDHHSLVSKDKGKRNAMAAKQKDQMNIPAPAADFSIHGALNIVESATYCGVRCFAIESAVTDGRLRGRRLGRNVIILKSDLDAFLASLDVVPPHTPPSVLARRAARAENALHVPSPRPAKKGSKT
jgi:hypothetical protein